MKLQLFASIALVLLNAVPDVSSAESGSLRGQAVDKVELVEDWDNDWDNDGEDWSWDNDNNDNDGDWDNDNDNDGDWDNDNDDNGRDFDTDDTDGMSCDRGKECGPGVRCKRGRCVPRSEFELWLDSMKVW